VIRQAARILRVAQQKYGVERDDVTVGQDAQG
jgi:hypothetical protein